MASDIEEFEAQFGATEFAGASVTAKAPDYSEEDKMLQELQKLPADYGMNVDATQEQMNAPVDYEMDIFGNSGDIDEFEKFIDSNTTTPEVPKEPKITMQEYAKTLPKDMSWEDRQIALREYRRDNLKNVQAPGLNTDQRASDFALGMSQTLMGVPATALDIARYTGLGYVLDKSGIDFTGLDEATQGKINQLKANVKDTDIFSANTMGQILPTLATLPVHVSRKVTASLVDAGITYIAMQGAGNDDVTSALGAIFAGGLTAGTMSILERLNGSKALDDAVTNLAAGKNVDNIYRNFAKYTGKDIELMTNHDKVVAILSSSEQQGASTLLKMAARDSKLKKSIDALMESPNNVVKEALEGNNIARTVKDMREQTKFAKGAYNELEKLAITYPTANINIGPAKQSLVDELSAIPEIKRSAGINKVLSTLQKENLSLADILDMRKHLNGINFKASRIDAKTRESINAVDYLDSVVDANLPAEFKQAFGEARSELALSYALQGKNAKKKYNNKFGELALEIGKGNETYATTLEKLVRATGGTNKFNELHRGLGYEQAKQFELGLVKEIQNSKGENLGELLGMVKELGFVTPEARDMVKRIRMLDKSFSSADFYNDATRVAIAGGLDSASITNDFLSKVQYSVAGTIWNSIKPYVLPLGDNAAQERMFRGIMSSVEKGLKNDTKAIKLETPHADMYKDFKPLVRDAIENSIRTQIDNLKGMSGARIPEGQAANLLEAPADFTVRADGTAVRQSGDAAQDALSREPINTTIVDEANMPSTSVKPSEDIIDVEWWNPTSTVVTPDGHVLSMEELLRAESLPDNMRLPEKANAPIKSFFDMKYKMKTDPDLIKAREEVKKATTKPAKDKAKDRLLKQLEYQRLREQGVKPSEAHRMSIRSSSEVGGALAGGTMNGVTIDDDGNIQVDPEAFLIGAAGGAAVVKGGKQLGKYIDEGNELMMQQAGGGTPPSSGKIDLNYKLSSVLSSVDDRQKFTPQQLESFLKGKGVSPYEIKASGILRTNEKQLTAKEWKQRDVGAQQFEKTVYEGEDSDFSYVTLGQEGANSETHKVNEWMANKDKNMPNTNLRHKMDNNSYTTQDYDNMSQLGWNRSHIATVKGKPTTVLNEVQSDWMQAERQSDINKFAKNAPNIAAIKENIAKLEKINANYSDTFDDYYRELYPKYGDDWYHEASRDIKFATLEDDAIQTTNELSALKSQLRKVEVIRDFPMKPEKFRQFMLVDALNDAITNDTNRVIIPIKRGVKNEDNSFSGEGKELMGGEGVTSVYENFAKDINTVADKLKKQGVDIKVGRDTYSKELLNYNEVAKLVDKGDSDSLFAYIRDNADSKFAEDVTDIKSILNKLRSEPGNDDIINYLQESGYFKKYSNEVHTIDIKMPENGKVSWDVYSIIGALGLTGLAEKLKESNTDK